MGYETVARAYLLWDPELKKIIVSRNVICNEKRFPCLSKDEPVSIPFEIDDVLTFPLCQHKNQHQSDYHEEQTVSTNTNNTSYSTNRNLFFNSIPYTVTFQCDRSLLSQQFPLYLPTPSIPFYELIRSSPYSNPSFTNLHTVIMLVKSFHSFTPSIPLCYEQ